MRSTNTQRLSVCVNAASGQQQATTLVTLNRRVAQLHFSASEKAEYLAQRDRRLQEDGARWNEQEKTSQAMNVAVASFALVAGLQSGATS